jgi:ABC-type branched-subunit amino acid transport system ATPase component
MEAMDIVVGEYQLTNLTKINVLLGKNGCGKSTLLKAVENGLTTDGHKRYITPERGGVLTYQPNVEQNFTENENWLGNSRRNNQFNQFREQSVVQFRRLELNVYRGAEARGEVANFGANVERLNELLDNIELRSVDSMFKFFSKSSGNELQPGAISSGESELVSLGIETLAFAHEIDAEKDNFLFLDEPDVHLHPDLQARLIKFLVSLVEEKHFTVLIATHSTAILGGLADYQGASVAFMQPRDQALNFEQIGPILKRVLPVFGAHPLSNLFNEAPVLIVEGDDDERIWQQAVRTSNGAIRVYPVGCAGVTGMSEYESEVRRIIGAVYEDARAYSLRDRDDTDGVIADEPPLIRMKLACRTAENLILTTEVLAGCGLDWQEARRRIEDWIAANEAHPRYDAMVTFRDGGFDREGSDLKDLRMLLAGVILNSTKAWEVLVGQAIARLERLADDATPGEGSLESFLGSKTVATLLP